jgi:hypothetical protein
VLGEVIEWEVYRRLDVILWLDVATDDKEVDHRPLAFLFTIKKWT